MNPLPHLAATPILQAILGLLLLVLGRRLFWLFVGVVGFFVGAHFGQQLLGRQPEMVVLAGAILIGLVGAVLAVFLERVAVAVAGGAAGGMLGLRLGLVLGFATQSSQMAAFLVGAILAAVLVSVLLDWTLIVLSALTGSVMVAGALPLGPALELVTFGLLAAGGIFVQARQLRGEPATPD